MTDQVFGELEFDDCGYWNGHIKLDFWGVEQELTLMIDSCYESQSEISDHQRETYRSFLDKWPKLQEAVVKELIRYYNEEDLNDNGVGIRLLNEEISETRYKDIAF